MHISTQDKALRLLHKRFGLSAFRPGQEEVISSVLAGKNTMAIMPTGSGKSLCYQLPALFDPGLTVVVSPLIALMQDQKEKIEAFGVETAILNSTRTEAELQACPEEIGRHRHAILLVTPEQLSLADFMASLKEHDISLFVIDEVHCISQWGHDFRPAFLDIPDAIRALGRPPVLALTATATDEVIQDVAKQLDVGALCVIRIGVYRKNLSYEVRQVEGEEDRRRNLLALLAETRGPVIVYTATVKEAEALHTMLDEVGESVALYHGRMAATRRNASQTAFMSDEVRVMVATNAFGMGIDKPDVRLIVHAQLPGSLDAYYQETGRAGRDGRPARCVLIHEEKDKRIQQFFLVNRYPSEDMVEAVIATLPLPGAEGVSIDELRTSKMDVPVRKLQVILKMLLDADIAWKQGRTYGLLADRDHAQSKGRDALQQYRDRAERDRDILGAMVRYARSGACRWRTLLNYFGDASDWEHCGHCDSCRLAREEEASAATPTQDDPAAAPSRSAPAFRPGDKVAVRRHGPGVVEAVTRERVDILFPDGRVRRFLPAYVRRTRNR